MVVLLVPADHASLLTQEEYFKLIEQDMPAAFESDGRYKGLARVVAHIRAHCAHGRMMGGGRGSRLTRDVRQLLRIGHGAGSPVSGKHGRLDVLGGFPLTCPVHTVGVCADVQVGVPQRV